MVFGFLAEEKLLYRALSVALKRKLDLLVFELKGEFYIEFRVLLMTGF